MQNLVLRDPVQRFKQGKKISFGLKGFKTSENGRFRVVDRTSGKELRFDSRDEAKKYQMSATKQDTRILYDDEKESRGQVVRIDRSKEKVTEHGRKKLEANNNLSFKQAYQKGRESGNKYFAWRGKVYKTDLKDGKNNMTEMMQLYGNNLGYSEDPNLNNKKSVAARQQYRKDVDAKKGNRNANYKGKTNKQASTEADKKVAQTWNEEDFVDALSPATAIENGINALLLGKDYKPTIAHSGLNPALAMANLMRGEWGKVGERALNNFSIFGGPLVSKGVNWLGTKMAPEIISVGNKSKYLSKTPRKSFIKHGSQKYINTVPELDETGKIVGTTFGGNPTMQISSGKTLYDGTTLFGRRSIENAAKKGLLDNFSVNGGFNNVVNWANTAVRNNNTGTTYFFRNVDRFGRPILHPYDAAIENGMRVMPWINASAAPIINTTANNFKNYNE